MEYRALSSIFYSNPKEYENIYKLRYNSESTYRFDFDIKGNAAFLVINNDILQRISKIYKLDCDLLRKMDSVPGVALKRYTNKCLIDEIKVTNEIEGVNSTRKEINDILNDKTESNKNEKFYGLVKRYELLKDEKINLKSCRDIRNLYDELVLQEVAGEDIQNKPDGNIFRKEKVFVQDPTGKQIHSGSYPEDVIISDMSKALDILNNDNYNYMIRIAVFHYMFGYIHPFYDGNGRTSRFISSYLLANDLQFLVSYKLSYTIKNNIQSYYKSFRITNEVNNKGDLTIFVIRFLDIIIESLNDLCESLDDGYAKLKYFEEVAKKISKGDRVKHTMLFILIQNSLFGDQGLDVEELQIVCEIGNTKVRSLLKEFEEAGLLNISKDGKKKLYDVNLDNIINYVL